MAFPVYSRSLIMQTCVIGQNPVYTDQNNTTVLRSITIFQRATSWPWNFYVVVPNNVVIFNVVFTTASPTYNYWEGRIVVGPGVTMTFAIGGACDLSVSGYALSSS